MNAQILTINGGSSSVKFALFESGPSPRRILAGQIERIGLPEAVLHAAMANGANERIPIDASDHATAANRLIEWLDAKISFATVTAIGHRIVHGGGIFVQPQRITPDILEKLRELSGLDPDHLPGEIALIEAFQRKNTQLPHVACFDTAFHHDLPRVAQILPIPRYYFEVGVRRYGFHGLSYAYLLEEIERTAGRDAARGRIILAHLGSGASLAAVYEGRCIDTTMAFTPCAGVVMGTRSGDVDPGLLVYLMREKGLSVDELDDLINRQSGLLGISEVSSDMRDLIAKQASDTRAADAVAAFCYSISKSIGAFSAALGGLDMLVFAGGIGEHSPEVRARICERLSFLGVRIEKSCNQTDAGVISSEGAAVSVRVMGTDEEAMIAREVERCLGDSIAMPSHQ